MRGRDRPSLSFLSLCQRRRSRISASSACQAACSCCCVSGLPLSCVPGPPQSCRLEFSFQQSPGCRCKAARLGTSPRHTPVSGCTARRGGGPMHHAYKNAPMLAHALTTAARGRFCRGRCFRLNAPISCVILPASWTSQHRNCMNCRQGHENIFWWQAQAPSQPAHYAYRPASAPKNRQSWTDSQEVPQIDEYNVSGYNSVMYRIVPHRRPDGSCPYEEYARGPSITRGEKLTQRRSALW